MNPILAHPSAKSITLTLSSKCLDPVMMRIATLLLTGQHWCAAPVAAPRPSHYAVGLSPGLRPFLPCCGWSSADTAALHSLTDRDCVRSTSRCAQAISLRRGTIPWPSPFPTVLRLVLGGHNRAPQPYGPRLCAQHQSLRPSHLTAPWDYPLAFAFSYRAAAGPRRTQPRSTDSRTQPTGPAESMQPNFPGGVLTRELIYSGQ
jgi:hypothetical protein